MSHPIFNPWTSAFLIFGLQLRRFKMKTFTIDFTISHNSKGRRFSSNENLSKIPRIEDFVPDLNFDLILTINQPRFDQSHSKFAIFPMNIQLVGNSNILVCLGITNGTYQLRVNYIIFNRTNFYLNSSSFESWSSCNFSILLSIQVLFQVFILIIAYNL